jgi:chemotaxis protein MotB
MRDKKKPEEPQEEGSPAWMNTYGDMVTLVLTFFVLLFSFSTIDASKWEEIVQSLSGMSVIAVPALDPNATEKMEIHSGRFIITPPTASPSAGATGPDGANVSATQQRFNEFYETINTYVETNNLGYILKVEYTDDFTVLLRMSDSAFFDSGSANIDEDAQSALNAVCQIFSEYEDIIKVIRIEGHTDNKPIQTTKYKDNWELSMDRADTVRKYIMQITDIDPALLAASYYGEYHPVADNDTEEGRAQNRRVDFLIESILKN